MYVPTLRSQLAVHHACSAAAIARALAPQLAVALSRALVRRALITQLAAQSKTPAPTTDCRYKWAQQLLATMKASMRYAHQGPPN